MGEPDYPKSKYEDHPPLFKRWTPIYTLVILIFVGTLLVLNFYNTWF